VTVSSLRWPLLALLGLLVAAAIAFLATRAVSTNIGISSEPATAGRSLSPAIRRPSGHKPRPTTNSTPTSTTTVTVPVPTPAPAPSGGGESGDD
jgi:hypothetical protein